MLLSWMAYATLIGAFVYGAAVAADRAASAWLLSRRAIWAAALLVTIAAPAFLALRPTSAGTAPVVTVIGASPLDATPAAPALATRQVESPPAWEVERLRIAVARLDPYAARAWLIASLTCLALLLRAAIIVRRHRARWTPAELDGVRVLLAPTLGPAVVGTLAPKIVVPRWALTLDPPIRDMMLRHETEHIRARDPLLLVGTLLATTAFPWNAPLWMIARRLRLAIEIDCDRRVLRACDREREYGELLLTACARHGGRIPFAMSLATRRPFLERRITAMTMRTPRHPRLIATLCVALIVAATTAAVRAPHPMPLRTLWSTAPLQGRGSDSLTIAEVRALIAAHHADALAANTDLTTVVLVVDANGAYVNGRTGTASLTRGAGTGRARGGGAGQPPSHTDVGTHPGMVLRSSQITTTGIPLLGLSRTTQREARLETIAADTMQLSVHDSSRSRNADYVFPVINSTMPAIDVLDVSAALLGRLVAPGRVEVIHARAFEAGQLGATPLHVVVVRLKP